MNEKTKDIQDGNIGAEKKMEIEFLYRQLNKLTDTKKEGLILFEINGFSIKEIAEIQGSTEGAVKVMLGRARRELKELMQDEPKLATKTQIRNG